MIEGISHITFIVNDPDRTADMLKAVLDAEDIYASGDGYYSISPEKFLKIGGVWIALMRGEADTPRSYNHVAFQIRDEDIDRYLERIRDWGLDIKPDRPRIPGEGRSIYFYDYDNHLFELHAGSLDNRLDAYFRRPTP